MIGLGAEGGRKQSSVDTHIQTGNHGAVPCASAAVIMGLGNQGPSTHYRDLAQAESGPTHPPPRFFVTAGQTKKMMAQKTPYFHHGARPGCLLTTRQNTSYGPRFSLSFLCSFSSSPPTLVSVSRAPFVLGHDDSAVR